MRRQRGNVRRGLSLLEVIIALAVFLMSFVAIGQLMRRASDQSVELCYQNQATQLANSKLAEVVAGADQAGSGTFKNDDADYSWDAEVQPGAVDSLQVVTVTVSRPYNGDTIKVTVSQMMIVPASLGSALDVPPTPLSSQSTSSGTGSTGSSSSSSSSSSSTK